MNASTSKLFQSLTLPNGQTIPNRLCKAAMEENLYDEGQLWMQINHPGRQVYTAMGETALSPSDKVLDMGKRSKMFAQPRAMTEEEIEVLIQRFVATSKQAESAGFTGVQVYAAHGYLISQRTKRYGRWRNNLAQAV